MKYTKKQFFADVKAEADAIKANATAAEIQHLNFIRFDYNSKYDCVYGQMCGHCRNERATHLIVKCCKRFVHQIWDRFRDMRSVAKNVNGETVELKSFSTITYLSSIEAYITMPDAKNKNLIAYIKGETDKLVL